MNTVASNLPLQQAGRPQRALPRHAIVCGRLLSGRVVRRTAEQYSATRRGDARCIL